MDWGDNLGLVGVLAVSGLFSLWCLVRIWRSASNTLWKLFWSLVCLIPILGPVTTLTLYSPPAPQADHLQQRTWRSGGGATGSH